MEKKNLFLPSRIELTNNNFMRMIYLLCICDIKSQFLTYDVRAISTYIKKISLISYKFKNRLQNNFGFFAKNS